MIDCWNLILFKSIFLQETNEATLGIESPKKASDTHQYNCIHVNNPIKYVKSVSSMSYHIIDQDSYYCFSTSFYYLNMNTYVLNFWGSYRNSAASIANCSFVLLPSSDLSFTSISFSCSDSFASMSILTLVECRDQNVNLQRMIIKLQLFHC